MRLSSIFLKFTALLLVFCLTSLPLAAQTVAGVEPENGAAATGAPPLSGILIASNANEVYVNGNPAVNGMTILSKTDLETKNSAATVAFGDLGMIRVCPQTKLNLDFDNERVDIKLMSGNARLEISPNVNGTIYGTDGAALRTDAAGTAATANCRNSDCRCVVETASAELPLAALPGVFPLLGLFGGAVTAVVVGVVAADEEPGVSSISVVVP